MVVAKPCSLSVLSWEEVRILFLQGLVETCSWNVHDVKAYVRFRKCLNQSFLRILTFGMRSWPKTWTFPRIGVLCVQWCLLRTTVFGSFKMEGQNAIHFLKQCVQASTSLDTHQRRLLFRVVEVGKSLLKQRLVELLSQHPHPLTLFQYSDDCTPLRLRKYSDAQRCGSKTRPNDFTVAELYAHQFFVTLAPSTGERLHTMLVGVVPPLGWMVLHDVMECQWNANG